MLEITKAIAGQKNLFAISSLIAKTLRKNPLDGGIPAKLKILIAKRKLTPAPFFFHITLFKVLTSTIPICSKLRIGGAKIVL